MQILLLSLLVLATAAVWPLNRWALRHGATPLGTGIVLSAVLLVGGLIGAAATGQPVYHPAAFFFGVLGGLAYAVGFVLFALKCLATGPVAPVATAWSLGLAGTVLATLLVPYAPAPSALTVIGFAATLLSVLLLGLVRMERVPREASTSPVPRDWGRLAVGAWGFSALTGATQLFAGRYAPQSPFGYIAAQALVSLLLLLVVSSTGRGGKPRAADVVAGIGTGVISAGLVPLTVTVAPGLDAVAVYPVMVAGPLLLVVLFGATAHRERLSVWGWGACAAGAGALVLLSLPHL